MTKLPILLLGVSLLSANAQNLLVNGNFEDTPYNNGWVESATVQFAGLAPGSLQAARVPAGQRIGQDLPTTGSDWYLDFYLAITNTANRAFAMFVNAGHSATDIAQAVINLRYQGGAFGAFGAGTFDGLAGLGSILYSVDANSDGDFDDVGDTKNVYRLRLTGHGWGTPAANYDVQLSTANSTNLTLAVNGLTRYQNPYATLSAPSAFIFNALFGTNPGFWVDDVDFRLIELPDDPNLETVMTGDLFGRLPVDTGIVTRSLTVMNSGAAQNLVITNATLSGPDAARYTVNASFPISVPPSGTTNIDVTFDPQTQAKQFNATLSLQSNDQSSPSFNVNLGATRYTSGTQLLVNPDFEATPYNLGWLNSSANITNFAGFAPGSVTAAEIGYFTRFGQNVVGPPDWHLDFYFTVPPEAVTDEGFSVYLNTVGDFNNLAENKLRVTYKLDAFEVNGVAQPALGALAPSVDANTNSSLNDIGDTKNVYHMRITSSRWGEFAANANIELSEANSVAFTRQTSWFTVPGANSRIPSALGFESSTAGNPGFEVDDVRWIVDAPVPVITDFQLLGGGQYALSWTSTPRFINYDVLFSTNLTTWETNGLGVPIGGSLTSFTNTLPAGNPGFFRIGGNN